MKSVVRASAVFLVLGMVTLSMAVPGISAPKSSEVVVVNPPGQPVPVTGEVSVGNTPSVNVANTPDVNVVGMPTVNIGNEVAIARTPFQDRAAASNVSSGGEECTPIEVPEGQIVMLQNISIEGSADTGAPNIYLRIVSDSGQGSVSLDRFRGELFDSGVRWSGFWDLDVLVAPPTAGEAGTTAAICAGGNSTARALATGYFE